MLLMDKEKLVCVSCPMGCHLSVSISNDEWHIKGNQCKRGITYARSELTNPCRTLTTTVRIIGATFNRIPVRTSSPIPKGIMFDAMKLINTAKVMAPVKVGDIIIRNILDTGVDIIASRSMGMTSCNGLLTKIQ